MADEPVTFVVERCNGREMASIIYGKLPERLSTKLDGGVRMLVYALRLDKLPNGAILQKKPIRDLYEQFTRMRTAGKLPPSNVAEPPKKAEGGQKGVERGPEFWWKPPPLPRGQDWTPEPSGYPVVIGSDEPEPAVILIPEQEQLNAR